MNEVYIISGKRTPFGSFGGVFKNTSAITLGAEASKNTIEAAGIDASDIDEVILGNVVSANLGQGPARQVAIHAGVPDSTPCTTINKLCASGMKSVIMGTQSIQLGVNDVVLCGGFENMSQIPFYVDKARFGYGYGNSTLIDGLAKDGLQDAYAHNPMGCFADATAVKHEISREEQDEYAIKSYQRAAKAWENGVFDDEVNSFTIVDRKGRETIIAEDEEYKKVFFDKIPKLKPVFEKDGTVTAANASTINDGAASILIASKAFIEKHNIKPLAKIITYADAAREPEWFTTAPILATDKVLAQANMTLDDIEYFEVNEAFSVVALAYAKHFNLPLDKVNLHGGAVSIGHPVGASGARIILSLLNVLKQNNQKTGLAAICNGGGGASAMILERM